MNLGMNVEQTRAVVLTIALAIAYLIGKWIESPRKNMEGYLFCTGFGAFLSLIWVLQVFRAA